MTSSTRGELQKNLWPDGTVVDFENGLNAAMGKLRQALRDSAENPKYIETLPRQGYRFIATLEPLPPPDSPAEAAPAVPQMSARAFRWRAAIGFAMLLVVLAAAALWVLRWRRAAPPGVLTIAVLPFQNLDGDPERQYFADGMTEELTAQLSRVEPQSLGVIARTSVLQYRASSKSIAQIGAELRVQYVMEGSVRRSGDRVRVTAQLIRTSDQKHVGPRITTVVSETSSACRVRSRAPSATASAWH